MTNQISGNNSTLEPGLAVNEGANPSSQSTEIARTEAGQFPKGVSGNPAGRPKSRKNELAGLKQDLEIAVREGISVDRVKRIVNRVAEMAENGNLQAAKLILDKVISNASDSDDVPDNGRTVIFRIENATFAANKNAVTPLEQTPIDVEVTEVKT